MQTNNVSVVANVATESKNVLNNLYAARKEVVSSIRGEYGARRKYGVALVAAFGEKFWERKGKAGADWMQERDSFKADLKDIGHSNPDKAWSDVLQYAGKDKPASAGKAEAGNAPKTTDEKTRAGLVEIINRITKAEDNNTECPASSLIKGMLIDALTKAGGSLN